MHASTAEILQAFQDLTPQELIGLYKYAQRHLSGIYTEPLDLVHEALHRSLDGRRNWPAGLSFAIYMIQTMKSIVNHDRERVENRPGRMVSLDQWTGASTAAGSWASVEDQVIALNEIELARKAAERTQQALSGDPLALKVLEGMLAGMSPREICDSHSMQPKDYDSARHRVMRKLRQSALQ
jgi:DNA-directed RNA polymerase specialized sigma24 family protein